MLHEVAERIGRRGDGASSSATCSTSAEHLIEALHHLRHKRHEVILMHVMAHDELDSRSASGAFSKTWKTRPTACGSTRR